MKKLIACKNLVGKVKKFPISELTFRPSVYGILIQSNKILLVKQKGGYDFPGGGINMDETIEHALKREFFEETGIKVKIGEVVDCRSNFFLSGYYSGIIKPYNSTLMYFTCKKLSGRLSNKNFCGYEKKFAIKPEWVELDKIKKIKYQNSVDSFKIIKNAMKELGIKLK